LAQGIVSAGEDTLRTAASNQMKRLADRIGTRGAGVGDDPDAAIDLEQTRHVRHLALHLIGFHPLQLAAATGFHDMGRAIVILADRHRGRGGSHHHRHASSAESGIGERLARCKPCKACTTVHARSGIARQSVQPPGQIHLPGTAHPLA
jgi:hypothetical protein